MQFEKLLNFEKTDTTHFCHRVRQPPFSVAIASPHRNQRGVPVARTLLQDEVPQLLFGARIRGIFEFHLQVKAIGMLRVTP